MALRGTSSNVNIANPAAMKLGLGLAPNLARPALGEIGNRVASADEPTGKQAIKEPKLRERTKVSGNKLNCENLPHHIKVLKPISVVPNNKTHSGFSSQILDVEDIDKDDGNNPQLVSELVNDIYDYMRQLENEYLVRQNYLQGKQTNARMRSILVDWLVQVHMRFQLLQETLFLTIAIIDRFLQEHDVSRSRLQLVGVTAMFIASKYEEMYAPEIRDFVFITDNTYTTMEIRRMECLILKTLDFKLGRPLPLHFLRRNSKAGDANATLHTLAKYLMELTLGEYTMVHISPSCIAAAALCLSMKILEMNLWNDTLVHYSAYSEKELLPVMRKMATLVTKAFSSKLVAVHTKYASTKFLKISCFPELQSHVVQDLCDADV